MTTKISTKERILQLLKKKVSLTVNDLTEELNISHMAVRKHLDGLQKEKLISSREVKQPIGRPLQIYFLAEKGEALFPKNYEGITLEFLQDIEEMYGEESIADLFHKREERLTTEYTQRLTQKNALEKMTEIVAIQNEKGYMADVSQINNNTFELVEYNCPIIAVANQYKTACQCETNILKAVLDADDVRRASCKTDGNDHCRFLITLQS
ncbi:transcriptional regulator [Robertmurraya siralis]|uniref:Transcriptional regulator n=1 Tax=Robertmurraya siralis TaxID=77777 RepID=A0A920BTR9_9BACI|nr:metalloregulator ArsR/SmtB family transcription factor [Robertmurraya siralis]PAE20405.1 transcriptional regulator [Bacillus sp. 7504-2]GIN62164.1 transcriptional regulator [Robertmurraya siralis]